MSELHEDLLAPRITKKRIIAVLLVTGFLISFFTFSVYLTSFLFGTQRIDPSERVEDADFDEYLLVLPPLPDDFKDLLDDIDLDDLDIDDLDDLKDLGIDVDDISPEDLEELAQLVDEEDIADFLEEMNDGDIDNYDLTEAGLLIAALLFSDVEVFRVYEYDEVGQVDLREDILWRYESFDQFNGDGWESTVPKSTMPEHDFPTLQDYLDNYFPLGFDKIKLKKPLSTNIGTNSFVMGSLFPEPYIIEELISADNFNPDPALSKLYKDDMESVIADLYFNSAENVSMYYELFGWGINPKTNEEINNTAVNAIFTPSLIKNQFLQLPPNIGTYKTNNPFFNTHWNALNSTINATDNAFMVANKIRNYLQSNFELSFDEMIDDPPAEGEDVVEWFCEKEEGLYSEFASAFCAFTRSFGVASRFVDGYNSRLIEEMFDTFEGLDTYAIKYKNIYNWAEIYVPGHDQWVQMDILYESFGVGGFPIGETRFNITVTSNATLPDLTYERGNVANISAILTNSTNHGVPGETIAFEDITTGQSLGSFTTDSNGVASIEVPIDSNIQVGPHFIKASRGRAENWTYFLVKGDVNVVITDLFPQEVNVSVIPHVTSVQGFVEDAVTHERLDNVGLNILLLYKGTNTPVNVLNPFDPMYTFTDGSGNFDLPLTVEDYIPFGQYDFRVDFNGTWAIPIDPYLINFNNINDSSDPWDFNVTKEITKSIWFYINDTEVWDYNNPIVTRPSTIELKAIAINETGGRSQGDLITFYDYTNNSLELGSTVTDANGVAIFNYDVDLNALAGPNLLYAKLGNVENYSYFILDSPIDVNLDIGPQPSIINSTTTTGRTFIIHGYLTDTGNGKPIKYGEISVHLFDGPTDVSYYLIQESGTTQLNETGEIYVKYSVLSSTPTKNYTIQVWFNGTYLYSFPNNINNEHNYFLNWVPNFSDLASGFNDLKVEDPTNVEIFLSVEDNPTTSFYNDLYLPERYNRGEEAHFQITIIRVIPAATGTVRLRDVYTNQILASYTYDGSEVQPGFIQLNVSTQLLHAGLHHLEVQYDSWAATNTTYIIINETVNIIPDPTIDRILRNDGGFTVSGHVEESGNGSRGMRVRIVLLNSSNDDVSYYLNFVAGYQQNMFIANDGSGDYEFRIDFIDLNCPYGEYNIRIDFNGTIAAPGIFLSNYMVHTNSSLISLNITAGTVITQGPYSTENEDLAPDYWINGDILHVLGDLNWDNGATMVGFIVNVTIQLLDGTIIAYNDTATTNSTGTFEALLTIDITWPDLRSDTKIVVYFIPIIENVESSEKEYI